MEITFDQAKLYRLKFGPPQYRGKTLDDIARFDDGLRYLDYLVGQDWVHGNTLEHIKAYLGNDGIKRDLENLI